MQQFIFGYGSLINSKSRVRTADTGTAIPVRVNGLQRAWNYHNPERRRNVLGVIVDGKASCNGVIIEVSEENLRKFDERECGYYRMELDIKDITFLNGSMVEGKIWVYIPEEPLPPTENSPLHQSYIDVVITGCLEFGEDFAVECITSSIYWDSPWFDDRNDPSYPGTVRDLPAGKIDKILSRVIPKQFGKRLSVKESSICPINI